jgi:hypothetical protein
MESKWDKSSLKGRPDSFALLRRRWWIEAAIFTGFRSIKVQPPDKAVLLFSFWEDEGYIRKYAQNKKPVFSSDRVRDTFQYHSSRNKIISDFKLSVIRKTRSNLAENGEVHYSDIANILK